MAKVIKDALKKGKEVISRTEELVKEAIDDLKKMDIIDEKQAKEFLKKAKDRAKDLDKTIIKGAKSTLKKMNITTTDDIEKILQRINKLEKEIAELKKEIKNLKKI